MTIKRLIKILLTAFLLASAGWLAVNWNFYATTISSLYFALALVSVAIIHFRVLPSWVDALLILACSAILAAVDFLILNYPFRVAAWFSFLGVGSLLVMGIRAVWSEGDDRKLLLLAFLPALLFSASEYFAWDFLVWTEKAHPRTLDLYLLSFDYSLYVQFSFLVGQAFQKWAWLRMSGIIFYLGLPILIALIYAGQLIRVREKSLAAMAAFLIAGPIGILFFNLFPALGPVHVFGRDFPWHPLTFSQASRLFLEPIKVAGPRNAIPSLHLAWALLVWWYSRGLSWWERAVALAFLIFTALATLGTGEHYVVDLIVAHPYALMIMGTCAYSLAWKDPRRVFAFSFGLLVTLGWLAALRYANRLFWFSPVIPWTLCATTVALTIFGNHRLRRAVEASAAAGNSETQRVAVSVS